MNNSIQDLHNMRLDQPKAANTSLKTWSQKNILAVAVSSVFILGLVQFSSLLKNHLSSNYSISVGRVSIRHAANTSKEYNHSISFNRVSIRHAANTSTEYSWIGNSWFPPPGVPYLSPLDLRLLFQKENTLWWGDSTSRQDFETILGMINADNIHNVPLEALDRNINKGKNLEEITQHCRNWNRTPGDLCFDMGQVTGTEITNYDPWTNANATTNATTNAISNHQSSSSHTSFGKFDTVRSQTEVGKGCFKGLSSGMRSAATFLQHEYSVIVLSMGIWEVLQPKVCQTANRSETPTYILKKLLDEFELLSSSSLYIIWKTNGPSQIESKDQGNRTITLIKNAQDWFASHNPLYMGLADFGTAVIEGNRSFDSNRITGDTTQHWGVEARLLGIQMAASHVQTKQKKALNEQ